MPSRLIRILHRLDWTVVLSVLTLLVIGFSAIYSVELSRAQSVAYLPRQMIALALGLALSVPILRMHYAGWRQLGRNVYLFSLLLLLLVLFFGVTIRGTTGWFSIFGFNFQPVEIMKVAFVIQMARYFGEKAESPLSWRDVGVSGAMLAIPVFLVMMQPDLGSASLLVGIWGMFLLFAGIRWYQLATFIFGGIAATVFGWLFFLVQYQKDRIAVFLQPSLDPLGAGYNVTQAKIAIGSGQLFGRGLGFGSQSQLKFLPEAQTDFIFSVISEELGLLGALLVISAFCVLFWRTTIIARRARDSFAAYLALGVGAAIFVQMFVNIAVNLTLLPTTGVALPFVSYGGSSLLISILLIALLQSIVIQQDPSDFVDRS